MVTLAARGTSEESRRLQQEAEDYRRMMLTGCKTWIQTEFAGQGVILESDELERLSNDLAQHIAGNLAFTLQLNKMKGNRNASQGQRKNKG